MQPQVDFSSFNYEEIFLCRLSLEVDHESFLKAFLPLISNDSFCGFGRELWAILSSGCVPPQLYSFSEAQSQLLVAGESSIYKSLAAIEGLEVVKSVSVQGLAVDGQLSRAAYVEKEFLGGLFVAYRAGSKPLDEKISGVYQLSCEGETCQSFIFTEDMCLIEDLSFGEEVLDGGFFYLPSKEKLMELPEMLNDRERIHLDEKIRGIHC